MKRIYIALILLCPAGMFTACERDITAEIVSTTAPALQVNVKDASGAPYQGASVKLYDDEAAWNAESEPLKSGQTTADGSVLFSNETLKSPGFYYVIATQGSLKAKAKTPYLLLNDGKTYFTITLK